MKKWMCPVMVEVSFEQIAKHIQVAARSGICVFGDAR